MILYRHIIREHILPFFYGFATIMFMLVMQLVVNILQKILSKNIAISVVLEIFIWSMAWMVLLAIPMACLVAPLMAFGRLSADSEITAVKASGRNLVHLLTPVLLAASLVALLLIFFNNLVYPEANHRVANLMGDISRKKPSALIEPNVLIRDFKNYVLHVREVDNRTGKLTAVKVFADTPGKDPTTIVADSGYLEVTRDEKYLRMTLFGGETHSVSRDNKDEYFVGSFGKQVIFIENVDTEFRRTQSEYRSDREKSASALRDDISEMRKKRQSYSSDHNETLDSLLHAMHRFDSLAAAVPSQNDTDSTETDSLDEIPEVRGPPADDDDVFIDKAASPTDSPVTHGATDSISTVASSDSAQTHEDTLPSWSSWAKNFERSKTRTVSRLQQRQSSLDRAIRRIEDQDNRMAGHLVELHKKYSIPIACIVFVLIGAPLGIMARGGGLGVGISYSLFFFIVYWAFLIGGESLAERLVVPAGVAMWSPNIVLGACGIYLVIHMIRERTVISFGPLINLGHGLADNKFMNGIRTGIRAVARVFFTIPVWFLNRLVGLLPGYLIRGFVKNTFITFGALIVVFVVVDYIGNLRQFETAGVRLTVLYYWYVLPWFIQLIAPICLLMASMFAVGKMAKYSELTAIKSSGISIRRLTLPLLGLGLLIAFIGFQVGERLLPEANRRREEVMEDVRAARDKEHGRERKANSEYRRNFYYFSDPWTVYRFQEFGTHPQRTKNVSRNSFRGDGAISEYVTAEKMDYAEDGWRFINGTVRQFGPEGMDTSFSYDTLPASTLTTSPEQMVARIKRIEEMSYWELKDAIEQAQRRGEKVHNYLSSLHFKIALPFMSFIVILLGVSITARAGRKGATVLFGAGLLITFAYWAMARVMLAFGENGLLDPLVAAWGANVLFSIFGLFLYRRASK